MDKLKDNEEAALVRILFVEDDSLARFAVRRSLEKMNFSVMDAEDCSEAKELWMSHKVDLVLMDYRLPDGTGLEVVSEMRAAGHDEPVVCFTGEGENISDADREQLGIKAVLLKPVNSSDLNEVLSSFNTEDSRQPSVRRSYVGKYKVISCPDHVTMEFLCNVDQGSRFSRWLALDMSGTTLVRDEALDDLLRMAKRFLETGNRLSLVGVSDSLGAILKKKGSDRIMDIVSDTDELASLGRRLVSGCERKSILDEVVL